MNQKLLSVAKGETPADLVIRNGKVVNVYSGEIYDGGVAICGDTIAAVGDVEYCIGEGTRVVDAEGKYLTPGFLDGHIHPESSSLAIRPFAEAVLAHGTTGIMTDLHEVGVVSGLEGIEAILKEAEATDLKIYFVVPSHVPFSPNLETSGGRFNPEIIRKALKRPDAVGLSECVGPYITAGFPDLLESFDTTLSMPGKTLQGHLPDMYGPAMSTCIAAGVSTDHESFCEKDVFERLRNGCHLMMREGSAARNMPVLLKTVMENHLDTAMVSIVTDDLHTVDLQERGPSGRLSAHGAGHGTGLCQGYSDGYRQLRTGVQSGSGDRRTGTRTPGGHQYHHRSGGFPRADHLCRRPPDHGQRQAVGTL